MAWEKQTNITGPASHWFTGSAYPSISMPSPAGRIDGDMYLKTVDPDGGTVWRWDGGSLQWVYTGADITGPQGLPGVVQSIVEGARIGVDSTDPANPVVSADPAAWADITGKPATFPPTVPIAQADVTNLVSDLAAKVAKAGDTMTGPLVLPGAPTVALEAATKGYVDGKTFDLHALPLKATPQATDEFVLANNETAWTLWKTTTTGIQNALKAAFDLVYQPLAAALTSWASVVRAAGFDAFVAAPSSANLRTLVTDESGTGALLFQNGALGTPASGTATNLTGLPYAGLLAAAISTAAEYLSNAASKLASVNALWAAAVPVALTSAASITANFGTFIDSECAMTVDGELAAPSGVKNGQKGVMWFTASGATRNLTLNAAYLLMTGVTVGPYAITTSQLLGVAYVARGGSIYVTAILRRG